MFGAPSGGLSFSFPFAWVLSAKGRQQQPFDDNALQVVAHRPRQWGILVASKWEQIDGRGIRWYPLYFA
jgi:hypothetical protein